MSIHTNVCISFVFYVSFLVFNQSHTHSCLFTWYDCDVCHVSKLDCDMSTCLIVCMCMKRCMRVCYELSHELICLIVLLWTHTERHTPVGRRHTLTSLYDMLLQRQPWMCEMCQALSWVHPNSHACVTSLFFLLCLFKESHSRISYVEWVNDTNHDRWTLMQTICIHYHSILLCWSLL